MEKQNVPDAFQEAVCNQTRGNKVANEQEVAQHPEIANYTVIRYSEKSVAIFGDTRAIKEQLARLGGRFNRYLSLNGERCAGWVFPKSKEEDIRRLVNSK